MSIAWNDILKLPEAALAGDRRLPKTKLAEQARSVKASTRPEALLDKIRDVRHFATLTKSNSYIQPVKDDTYDIESVIFLTCGVNSTKGTSDAIRMIHACFPNPTVMLVEGFANPGLAISVGIRRKSLAERGAFVTEREATSGLFDPKKESYQTFLGRISFRDMPQSTLLTYAEALADRCLAAYSVRTLGFYPICKDEDTETLMAHVKELRTVEGKINELQETRKTKDATLSETTKLRMKIRKMEQERDSVMGKIKELCQ